MTDVSTIAAVATPPGQGGVGVLRISGPEAFAVLGKLFKPNFSEAMWAPQKLRLGQITDPETNLLLDEALAVWFKAPHSFTGEETVEIQCHGGNGLLNLILRAVIKAGAVLAEPGEFTKRAFLNGRLDLSQAEAVADLIAAQSRAEASMAARQLAGSLKIRIEAIQKALLRQLAELEANLDFSDDIDSFDPAAWKKNLLAQAVKPLDDLLEAGRSGAIFKDGLKLALAGAPNVGKSSLFNALVGNNRALVSPAAGTTRDFITTETILDDLRLELCDTAGLSETPQDELDALGQERSKERLAEADLILWVKDHSQARQDSHAISNYFPPETPLLTVWNKIDLTAPTKKALPKAEFPVSAKTGEGLAELKTAIIKTISGQENPHPPEVAPNTRHLTILQDVKKALTAALDAVDYGQPPEIWALELKDALNKLGRISGRTTPNDVLTEIFSRFCLGK